MPSPTEPHLAGRDLNQIKFPYLATPDPAPPSLAAPRLAEINEVSSPCPSGPNHAVPDQTGPEIYKIPYLATADLSGTHHALLHPAWPNKINKIPLPDHSWPRTTVHRHGGPSPAK